MIKAVIFDMFETLVTHFESPVYMAKQISNDIGISECKFREIWECLYIGDGGTFELETAQSLGMYTLQATWYLKNGVNQNGVATFSSFTAPDEVVEF